MEAPAGDVDLRLMQTLADLLIGERATIRHIEATRPLAVRLMELGLVEGTTVRVVRKAPLGDPLELELRGYSLSIRRDEARLVHVRREAP